MRNFQAGKTFLVALSQGFLPYADPLVCDDLRGPESLFGEGMQTPRPTRSCTYASGATPDKDRAGGTPSRNRAMAPEGLVLWESRGCAAPLDAAGALLEKEPQDSSFLSPLSVPAPVFLAGRSTSSFSLAWELEDKGLFSEWSSVVCSCQTEGRGQMRRHWHSPRGNLYVTLRLPRHPALSGDAASVVAGYLLVKAFRRLGYPLKLKWPNDLVIEENIKVGGILLEERKGVVLAGVGLNIAEAPPETVLREDHAMRAGRLLPYHFSAPADQRDLARTILPDEDVPLAPFPLWRLLVTGLILEYTRTVACHGLAYVLDDLNREDPTVLSHAPGPAPVRAETAPDAEKVFSRSMQVSPLLAWKGRQVHLSEGEDVSGRILGVGPGGGLLLCLPGGGKREFFSGSLSLSK